MMTLSPKAALVTSSSGGICARTAEQLAQAGAKVMICGRNAAQGQATVARIRRAGGSASFILTDIAALPDVQAAIDETIATYGRLDILFNYASAHYNRDGALAQISEATWDRSVEASLKGIFFCCQYALPFLRQGGDGTVINLVEQPVGAEMSSRPGPSPETTALVGRAASMASICFGGLVAMTQEISRQCSDRPVSANLILATTGTGLLPALPNNCLYGPAETPASPTQLTGQPFASLDEAVLYLAQQGKRLQGAALMVNTAGERSR